MPSTSITPAKRKAGDSDSDSDSDDEDQGGANDDGDDEEEKDEEEKDDDEDKDDEEKEAEEKEDEEVQVVTPLDAKKRKLIEIAAMKREKGAAGKPANGAIGGTAAKQAKEPTGAKVGKSSKTDTNKPPPKKTGPALISEAIAKFGTTMTTDLTTSALTTFEDENAKTYKYPVAASFAIKQKLNEKAIARLYSKLNAAERIMWLEGNGFPLPK
jgi:hypothetical protein